MIKPDGMSLEYKIMSMVKSMANIAASKNFNPADMEKIKKLYEMYKGAFFYERLIKFFKGKSIKVFLLEEKENYPYYKKNFTEDLIDLVGDTDPAKAKPGTIRSMSNDSLDKSIAEKRALNNLVHRSRTQEEAKKEASIFFEDI